ncbi:hypothetical protein CYMTET_36915 [Cymbomonas tetramitiformis]|uniref:Uncharacterized protein n=1 Tax=Cymbomonas tetramitiformis TaxID=36881 RepID=A0AAE0F7R2_9CHLO|nr:hypothetical protein CYMTET_36915 [Cymbomonas tetramitiformis]
MMAGSHLNVNDVVVMEVSKKLDTLYQIFANDEEYVNRLKLANPNVRVVLPQSLVSDEPHFTIQNYTDDTEGRVSALPLTWPINEDLALHEMSRTEFYDEPNRTTPFDAFVAFLAYLVSQRNSTCEQGISHLRLEETVMESFSLIPRVRISLEFETATSLGIMYLHENMQFSDKAHDDVEYDGQEIQMQAYDTTPTLECGVFSASFVHVCETDSGLPLLLDLALHDLHGKVVFRTPCLPYLYGITYSPVILNFLRVGTVARMFCSGNAEEKKKAQQVEMIKVLAYGKRLPVVTSAAYVCITCDRETPTRGPYVLHKVNQVVHRAEVPFAIIRGRRLRTAKSGQDMLDYLCLEARVVHGYTVPSRTADEVLDGYTEHCRRKNPHSRKLKQELQRHQYVSLATSYGLECAETVRAIYMTDSVWTFLSDAALLRALGIANLGVVVSSAAPPFDDEETLFREGGFRSHLLAVGIEEPCDAEEEFDRCVRARAQHLDVRVTRLGEGALFSLRDSFEEMATLKFPITDDKLDRLRSHWTTLLRSDRCEIRLVVDARCPLLRVQLDATRKRRAPTLSRCEEAASSGGVHVKLSSAWTDDRTLRGCSRILRKVLPEGERLSHFRVSVWDNREILPEEAAGFVETTALQRFLKGHSGARSGASTDLGFLDRLGAQLQRVDLTAAPSGERGRDDELRVSDDAYGSDEYVVGGWGANLHVGAAGIVREIRDAHVGSKRERLAARADACAEPSQCAHLLRVELVWGDADSAERFEAWVAADGARWRPVDGFPLIFTISWSSFGKLSALLHSPAQFLSTNKLNEYSKTGNATSFPSSQKNLISSK